MLGNGEKKAPVLNILASDILIADRTVELPYNLPSEIECIEDAQERSYYEKLEGLLLELQQKTGLKRGQKAAIRDEALFRQFASTVAALPHTTTTGGSSANTLITLSRVLGGDYARTHFIGVLAEEWPCSIIREDMESAYITLIPDVLPVGSPKPVCGTSFVFTQKNGERTIATYRGNAHDTLSSAHITPDVMKSADIVFIQGSLWDKFGVEFADTLMNNALEQNKEIWLALPTHSRFSEDMPHDNYQWLVGGADVVLGNEDELKRIYQTDHLDRALRALQDNLRDSSVAFITLGKEGASVVTTAHIETIPALAPPAGRFYKLGAGDTSFAGFLAGYMAGLSHSVSAELAMQLANIKLSYKGARIDSPRQALQNGSSQARDLLKKLDAGIHATFY